MGIGDIEMLAEPKRTDDPARLRLKAGKCAGVDMRETNRHGWFSEEPAVFFLFRLITGQGPGAKEWIDPIQSVRL